MSYNIINVIRDLLRGKLRFASKLISTSRYQTCVSCEARSEQLNICTACGCYLPLKVRIEKSTCPMELWEK
ncbi:MAG: DUF6171 family protein [Nitrososphaeraceae archaeon]